MANRNPLYSLPTFGVIAVVVVGLDQLTKWLAVMRLADSAPFEIIPRLLQLTYRTNTGAAWSMFSDHPTKLALFSSLVAVGLIVWTFMLRPEEVALRPALGLVVGGAVGNLIDRFRLGHVIDFIDAHWEEAYHFPTFNIADSAICVGIGVLFVIMLRIQPADEDSAAASPDPPGKRR